MRMVAHKVTSGGNVIATYQPNGEVKGGSFLTIEPSAAELERRKKIAAGVW